MIQNTQNKKTMRDSGLELLRFIAIILIVLHHACISGGLEIFQSSFNPVNHAVVSALGIWGMFGVDIFFLISFWFMLEKKFSFRIESWIRLVIEVIILALIAYAVAIVFFHDAFSAGTTLKTMLSPVLNTYWFITVYLIVFLFMPFFRVVYERLSNGGIITLFCIAFIAIPAYRGGYGMAPISSLDYAFFMVSAAMLVKRFEEKIKTYALVGAIVCILASILGIYAGLNMGKGQGMLYELCVNRFSPFQSLGAIFVFVLYKNRVSFKSKAVNFLAKGVLGVYILHASPSIAQHIWIDLFRITDAFKQGPAFALKLIVATFAVVIVCLPVSLLVHKGVSLLSVRGIAVDWINGKLILEEKD